MYAHNTYSRRRPEGWAERRRHFRRLTESERAQAVRKPRAKAPEPSRRA